MSSFDIKRLKDIQSKANAAFDTMDGLLKQQRSILQSMDNQAKDISNAYQQQKDKNNEKLKKKNESCGIFDSVTLI